MSCHWPLASFFLRPAGGRRNCPCSPAKWSFSLCSFRLVNLWVSCPVPSLNLLFTWRAEEAALGYVSTECALVVVPLCCALPSPPRPSCRPRPFYFPSPGPSHVPPQAPPPPPIPLLQAPVPSTFPPQAPPTALPKTPLLLPLHPALSPPRHGAAGAALSQPCHPLLRGPHITWGYESELGLAPKLSCNPRERRPGVGAQLPLLGAETSTCERLPSCCLVPSVASEQGNLDWEGDAHCGPSPPA